MQVYLLPCFHPFSVGLIRVFTRPLKVPQRKEQNPFREEGTAMAEQPVEEQSAFEENKAVFIPAADAQKARIDFDAFLNFAAHRGPEWAAGYLAALEGIYPLLSNAAYGKLYGKGYYISDAERERSIFDIVRIVEGFMEDVKAHRAGSNPEGSVPDISKAPSPEVP